MNRSEAILLSLIVALVGSTIFILLEEESILNSPLYIQQDEQLFLVNDCERTYKGLCRMYTLPADAADDIYDAIQPYRRKQ